MGKFGETLELVRKHWMLANIENDELVLLLAEQFTKAGTDEEEIKFICDRLGDLIDSAFERGLSENNY